ncbi:MAG: Holliday junction resolvase RuvX [Clostridia bacterium]|nr:Holliday junction resolvase RuvX [Clostridia bacterium]
MRILGIDYGDARVGIAISDELNITAQGLQTIQRRGSDKVVLKEIEDIIKKYEIGTIVIGMPYNMDGSKTDRAEITTAFIHKLKCKFNKIKIQEIDERLTTVAAHRTMNELNINRNKKTSIVDTISAVYILEMYMNRLKN